MYVVRMFLNDGSIYQEAFVANTGQADKKIKSWKKTYETATKTYKYDISLKNVSVTNTSVIIPQKSNFKKGDIIKKYKLRTEIKVNRGRSSIIPSW